MRPVTARGFRDVLPAEAAEREAVSRTMAEVFSAWGYGLVETPVVEDLAALEAAAGPLEGTAFRLIDLDGRLLALRPDMTVPIARITASRLAGQPGPHRFRYAAEVFREHESLRGQARQFSQAGVELVGAGGPAADAEVVAVLVEALAASGLARVHGGARHRRRALRARGGRRRACRRGARRCSLPRTTATSSGSTRSRARRGNRRGRRRAVARSRVFVAAERRSPRAAWRPQGSAATPRSTSSRPRGSCSRPPACTSASSSTSRSCARSTTTPASSPRRTRPGSACRSAGGGRYDGVLAAFDAPAPAVGLRARPRAADDRARRAGRAAGDAGPRRRRRRRARRRTRRCTHAAGGGLARRPVCAHRPRARR